MNNHMNNLEQFYDAVGANADEVIGRLGGDPALVMRFLARFQDDDSFSTLCTALDGGDAETAFRAAHTIKGVCANLGLQTLFSKASEMTELLRAGKVEDAKGALPALEAEYNNTCALLARLS
jgi:histidine phosphotransfer protein HptB